MLLKKEKLAKAKPPTERLKLRWNVVLKDLVFLAFLALAQFMVWRTLRSRYRESSARRKKFKLLRGGDDMAQGVPRVWLTGIGDRTLANGKGGLTHSRNHGR